MKNITQSLKIIILALVLSFGVSFVYAWTGPTATPPAGNTTAPINTSTDSQYKNGALGVGGLLKGYSGLVVNGQSFFNSASGIAHVYSGYNDGNRDYGIYQWQDAGVAPSNYFQNNVGIGTTNPTAKLEIGGTAGVDGIKFPDGTMQTTASGGSSGNFVIGTYIGEGSNYHEISIGFQPDDVEVGTAAPVAYSSVHRNKNMSAEYSQLTTSGDWSTNGIRSFTPNGFALGSVVNVNENGRFYWYKAFKSGALLVAATPVINNISISPSPIGIGQSTVISWSSTNAVSCEASNQWTGTQSPSGSIGITPTMVGSAVTYTLTCYNSDGSKNDTKSATVDVRNWVGTAGNGNYGESCNTWLSRTGQAGVNGSATRVSGAAFGTHEGMCLYGSITDVRDTYPLFLNFTGGGQGIDFYGALSSDTSDSRVFPFHWHCCGDAGNTEASTQTRR